MDKNFRKFKRKARLQAIFAAILFGIFTGLLVTSAWMLISKLSGNEFNPVLSLAGVGAALLISLILYFVFMPNDMKLAARLDRLYTMDEKISTMVEFREESGDFYRLQREDAEQRLGEQPIRTMKSKPVLVGLVSAILSLSLLVGSVFVPVKASVEPPIDEFDKQWILTSLDELITLVRNSYMADKLKDDTVTELTELVEFVEGSNLMSEMKKAAIECVSEIDESLTDTNTAAAIGEKFTASANEKIADLGEQLKSLSGTGSKNAIVSLGEDLLDSDYDSIGFAASELNSYLASSGAPVDDSVYIIFKTLASEMQNGSKSDIEEAIDDASKRIINEVIIQNVNASTAATVITSLCNLFGITSEDLKDEGVDVVIPERDPSNQEIEEDERDDENDNPMGSGGLGTGDVIYGSDDMIYDPSRDTYVPYGVLLNEYFAKANELITDGKISDEAAELIEYYYGLLYGSYNENDESNK